MGFLLSNWKLILIAVLTAACALFFNLWQSEVKAFATFKGEVAALGQAAEQEAKRINDLHARTLKEVNDEWAKKVPKIGSTAIDNYMRRFPRGLCGGSGSGQVPGLAGGAEASDGAKPERVAIDGATTSRSGSTEGDAFISECAKDAAKLKSLRGWVQGNQLPIEK